MYCIIFAFTKNKLNFFHTDSRRILLSVMVLYILGHYTKYYRHCYYYRKYCEFFKNKFGPEKTSHKPEKITRIVYEIYWPYAEYVAPFRNASVRQT